VLAPLVRARLRRHSEFSPDGYAAEIAARKLTIYQELEELELEREMGDLSAEEYAALYGQQKQRVLNLVRSQYGKASNLDATIEREIQAVRAARRAARVAAQAAPAEPVAAPAGAVRWGWIAVPAVLVLVAVGLIAGLYQSTSRTLTEQVPIARLGLTSVRGLVYAGPETVLLASSQDLLRSTDSGRTWQPVAEVGPPLGVAAVSVGTSRAYIFTSDTVLTSTDGGTTWQRAPATLPSGQMVAVGVDTFVPARVYAAFADQGLAQSRDGGKTWQPFPSPPMADLTSVFAASSPPALYVASRQSGVHVTTDDGATWQGASGAVNMALAGAVRYLAGDASGTTLYAATSTGLYLSTNGGRTWIDLPLRKPLQAVAVHPTNARVVLALTEAGDLYRSRDGGISWRAE